MKINLLRGATALLLLLGLPLAGRSQSVGIGTATPDAKAALDIRATDRGLLVPRLTAAQRTAIAAPPQGLLVYQTDGTAGGGAGTGFWYFGGAPAAWVFLNPAGGGADNLGNHTATTNLNLGANALTGTGASLPGFTVGLGVRADGGLNVGQNTLGNMLVGYQAGQSLTPGLGGVTGSFNQFIGVGSGFSTTTGRENQFSGYKSGYDNTTGSYNLFSGFESGYLNTTGRENQFIGYKSGLLNTTGNNNLFIGYKAGDSNSTGSNNLFIGYNAGDSNSTGGGNQFIGYQAGSDNTTGRDNQFSGPRSGDSNTTGSANLFIGASSGSANTTGSRNWAFGVSAGPTSGNLTNAGAIGFGAEVSLSNSLVLGGLGRNAVNVGIGTSSPSRTLDVRGTGLFAGDLAVNGTVNMGWTQVSVEDNLRRRVIETYTLPCPKGMRALGGGGGGRDNDFLAQYIIVNYSGPDPADPERQWRVILTNNSPLAERIAVRIYCNCARIAP